MKGLKKHSHVNFKYYLVVFIIIFNNNQIKAQLTDTTDSATPKPFVTKRILLPDINGQLDLIDILNFEFKNKEPKFLKKKKEPLGNGPFISILPGAGYALVSGFTGAIATGISFYTDSSKSKLSTILSSYNYSAQNQFWTIHNFNIFFIKEKINFTTDWRYYNFPTTTYGLGSNSTPSNALPINFSYLRLYQVIYSEIGDNYFIGGGYMLDYHWNIREGETPGNVPSAFDRYGPNQQSLSSGVSLNFMFDSRASSINPQNGSYYNIQYRDNLKFIGSNNNWQSLLIDLRKYVKLPFGKSSILALWSYNFFTFNGNPPYLDLPSIGWDDYSNTGRGYVQGRFRGSNLVDLESEFRYRITKNGLLGGVVFGNVESVSEWPSNKMGTIVPGYGLGLRIKINKKSNTNVAIDYGIGKQGSRGFFFNLGEVF